MKTNSPVATSILLNRLKCHDVIYWYSFANVYITLDKTAIWACFYFYDKKYEIISSNMIIILVVAVLIG